MYLVNNIIKDFPNLFIVIYHGNCLRLYLSKNYEKEIKFWAKYDAKNSLTKKVKKTRLINVLRFWWNIQQS